MLCKSDKPSIIIIIIYTGNTGVMIVLIKGTWFLRASRHGKQSTPERNKTNTVLKSGSGASDMLVQCKPYFTTRHGTPNKTFCFLRQHGAGRVSQVGSPAVTHIQNTNIYFTFFTMGAI